MLYASARPSQFVTCRATSGVKDGKPVNLTEKAESQAIAGRSAACPPADNCVSGQEEPGQRHLHHGVPHYLPVLPRSCMPGAGPDRAGDRGALHGVPRPGGRSRQATSSCRRSGVQKADQAMDAMVMAARRSSPPKCRTGQQAVPDGPDGRCRERHVAHLDPCSVRSGTSACSFWQYGQVVSVNRVRQQLALGRMHHHLAGGHAVDLAIAWLSPFSVRLTRHRPSPGRGGLRDELGVGAGVRAPEPAHPAAPG